MIAFVVTRLPVLIGAGLLLAASTRRWRDDRAVARLLIAAGLLLLLGYAGEAPVREAMWGGTYAAIPLIDWLYDERWLSDRDRARWGCSIALAASAACGLAAVFRCPAPAKDGAPEA
ncbi:hypothetical protein [Alienimonas chondri]|uniref:hypothetical protein n=1 Tax=Alienimonas chondri TaxID=2681879 RepID=UPI0019D684A6|nr:hypothetical protein [Alienimonas chondri]